MTTKSDFTEQEWDQVLEAPTSAGMLVATAQRGGTFRESFSMAKAYSEARQQHGQSELLDEIVSARPKTDTKFGDSPVEARDRWVENVREGAALIGQKASTEEVEAYKRFIIGLAQRVAAAAKDVSDSERKAIEEIAQTLGVEAPAAQ
jgi:tellurite resistance protein